MARGGQSSAPKTRLVRGPLDAWGPGPRGSLCRSGKAREETGTWKRTFRGPGRTTCARPGQWRRRRGGWNPILVAPEASGKLELVRVCPAPGAVLGPRVPRPHSLGRQERFCLQSSPPLAAGRGLRPRANRCGAAAAPARAGEGAAGGRAARPELEPSQAGRAALPAGPGRTGRPPADVQLMFDPSRDLCLRLAPRGCPAGANLAFVQGGSGHTQGRKRGEGGPAGMLPAPRPSPPIFPIPAPSSPRHP